VVIALFFGCFGYICYSKFKTVANITRSPKENTIDFSRIETVN
jgi:hypothetical protein